METRNPFSFLFFPCSANPKILAKEVVDGISVVLYYVKGTDDYYLSVSHFGNKEIILVDSRLSEFEGYMDENISMYVGYINGMDKNYKLTINGKDVNLGELTRKTGDGSVSCF